MLSMSGTISALVSSMIAEEIIGYAGSAMAETSTESGLSPAWVTTIQVCPVPIFVITARDLSLGIGTIVTTAGSRLVQVSAEAVVTKVPFLSRSTA